MTRLLLTSSTVLIIGIGAISASAGEILIQNPGLFVPDPGGPVPVLVSENEGRATVEMQMEGSGDKDTQVGVPPGHLENAASNRSNNDAHIENSPVETNIEIEGGP